MERKEKVKCGASVCRGEVGGPDELHGHGVEYREGSCALGPRERMPGLRIFFQGSQQRGKARAIAGPVELRDPAGSSPGVLFFLGDGVGVRDPSRSRRGKREMRSGRGRGYPLRKRFSL